MSNDISIVTSTMPAHLKKGTNLGNENISSEHLSTPRLKQLQQLSNEVDENHSEYIEGAKVGDFINTVTKEDYGKELYLVNVHYKEEFVVWKQLEKGGVLVGTFPTQNEALQHLEAEGLKVEDYDINRTQTHTLLKVDEKTGDVSDIPFLFDCSISKLIYSSSINSSFICKN